MPEPVRALRTISDILKELAGELRARGIKRFKVLITIAPRLTRIKAGESTVIYASGAARQERAAGDLPGNRQDRAGELTPAEERVERCLTDERQTAKALAHQCGFSAASGSFYGIMRALVEKGKAVKCWGGGYRRTSS